MKEYKRLTKRLKTGKIISADIELASHPKGIKGAMIERLAELEDAIESGELVMLPCKVGDWVYLVDNERHWAKVDAIRIYNENNGTQKIIYEWVQYDVGVDVTELWDEGEFDIEDIGKTVLIEKSHNVRIKELQSIEEKKFEAQLLKELEGNK